jgi:hypothetical protein
MCMSHISINIFYVQRALIAEVDSFLKEMLMEVIHF